MDVKELKKYIIENDKVEYILENLNCQKIKFHNSGYWTCGNPPPSDNPNAVTIYKDNLKVINYTKDMPEPSDIFTLIEYYKGINFFKSLKWICDLLEVDFYRDSNEELPKELLITKQLMSMKTGSKREDEDDTPIKILDEFILSYYFKYVNDFWKNDGVSYSTQQEFEIGYDPETNRITIPIRLETGELIGIKGRLFKEKLSEYDQKFIYLFPCPKSKILYGYYKTYPYIKKEKKIFIGESEKMVGQLWTMGIYNSVSIGGHSFSKTQIQNLSRIGSDIIICFDKDIKLDQIQKECSKFPEWINVKYMYDKNNILTDKESPSDNNKNFEYLLKNNIYSYGE